MNFPLITCYLFSLFISANSLTNSTELKLLSRPSEADFVTQQMLASEAVTNENGKMPVFYAHQWINFLSWGFLVDIGIIVARYGKKHKYWLQFHSILMFLLLVCSITAEFMMHYHFQRPPSRDVPKIKEAHKYIGFTFLGLMLAQLLNGVTLSLLILQPRIFNFLKFVQLPHLFLGTLLYLVGKVQVGLGVYIIYYEDRMNIALWSVYGFVFFWRIILETLYRKGTLALYLLRKPKEADERLLKQLDSSYFGSRMAFYINSSNESDLQSEFGNRLWCIFNNSIVDLTNFVHPGGQFILQAVKGREVSRFIYGAYGLESMQITPYTHSDYAKELINYFTVGNLNSIPFFYEGGQDIIGESVKREIWQNTSQKLITAKTGLMGFTHERLSIRSYLFSINCMGRYFLITPVKATQIATRPYTMVLSITDESADFRNQLEKFLEHHISEDFGEMKPFLEVPKSRKELPLLIKRYESETGFSQYIHSNPNERYYIEGPFGTSFSLPNDGTLVMICGGTGIFPLLDLLDYFYKQTIYMLLLEKAGKEVAEQSNMMSYKFNQNLRVLLIFSVFDESELIGQDIYLRMLKMQSKLKQPFFDMILKIRKPLQDVRCVTSRFDKDFFNQMLDLPQCSRFLICGPPGMNRDVPLALMDLGVTQEKIHLI